MGSCVAAQANSRNEHQITLQDQESILQPASSPRSRRNSAIFLEKALSKYEFANMSQKDGMNERKITDEQDEQHEQHDQAKRLFMRQDCRVDFTEFSESPDSKRDLANKETADFINTSIHHSQDNTNNNITGSPGNISQTFQQTNTFNAGHVNPVVYSQTQTGNPVQRQVSFQKQCSIQKQLSIAKQLSIQKQNSIVQKQGSSFMSTFPTQLLSPRSTQSQANLGLFTSQSSLNPLLKVSYVGGANYNNNNQERGSGGASQLSNIPSSMNSLPTSTSNIMQTTTANVNNSTTNNPSVGSSSNPNISSSSMIADRNILSPNIRGRSPSQERRNGRKNPSNKKMSLTVIDFSNRLNNHYALQQQQLMSPRQAKQTEEFEEILTLLSKQNVDVYIIQQLCDTFLERRRREYGDQTEEFQEAVRDLSIVLFKQQLNDLGKLYLDQLVLQKKFSTQQSLLKNLHEYQMKHV